MGEFKNNMKYAKSVGADVSKPIRDYRTTSQRITDEMNEMRAKLNQGKMAYDNLVKDWADLKKRHQRLVELVDEYLKAYDNIKYEYHHGSVESHRRANHKHDNLIAALRQYKGE